MQSAYQLPDLSAGSCKAARGPVARPVYAHLCYPGAQKTPHNVLVPLQFGLYDDEGEIGLWVHVASHLLDLLNLRLDALVHALEKTVGGPSKR